MQQIMIIGNLTKIPELRTTPNGKEVCNFTVAVNKRGKDAGAEFFRIAAWGELANICQRCLDKGKKVCVIGNVSARAFMHDGEPVAQMEIMAHEVEFLSPKETKVQDDDNPWG